MKRLAGIVLKGQDQKQNTKHNGGGRDQPKHGERTRPRPHHKENAERDRGETHSPFSP